MNISRWVDRDGGNKIISVYPVEQRPGQEKLNDQDQEILDFYNPPYATTVTEARQRKRKEELKIAMDKFVAYRDSSPKITGTQEATYRATLEAKYDTEETAILAINTGTVDGDIAAIRDYAIAWPEPA